MRRKRRQGEVVCRCRAYKFPHRQMGGECDGSAWVLSFFEQNLWGACRDCPLLDANEMPPVCQAVEGQEPPRQCPELGSHISFEGIKLYGVNKPPPKRMGWRR